MTWGDIFRDLGHTLFHLERGIGSLILGLATHPGLIAREYVQGARRKYFGPFAFLFMVAGVATLIALTFDFHLVTTSDTHSQFVPRVQRHPNILLLAQVPLLALASRLMLFFRGDNYAEHFVLAAYTSGMRMILMIVAIAISPWVKGSGLEVPLVWVYWIVWFGYFGWATSQFHGGNRVVTFLLGTAAAAMTSVAAWQTVDVLANTLK